MELAAEARAEYDHVAASDPDFLRSQERLVYLGAWTKDCEREAQRGLKTLEMYPRSGRLISDTALCLHHCGRSQEAHDLVVDGRKWIEWTANECYGLACYESALRNWEPAAQAIVASLIMGQDDGYRAFCDADLTPLFEHAAKGRISTGEAIWLAHPKVIEALAAARTHRGEIPVCFVTRQSVPSKWRNLLKSDPSSRLFFLPAGSPASIRRGYLEWQQDELRRCLRTVARASRNARNVLLSKQVGWARAALVAGNYLGARWHMQFALERSPDLFPALDRELRPLGFSRLLDEANLALRSDRGWFRKLNDAFIALLKNRLDDAEGILDRLDERLPGNGFCRLRRIHLEKTRGRHDLASKMAVLFAQEFPLDPVPYAYAIESFISLEDWSSAEKVFNAAPLSYRLLKHHDWQEQQLQARALLDGSAARHGPFYGQPDLGRAMKPSQQKPSQGEFSFQQ